MKIAFALPLVAVLAACSAADSVRPVEPTSARFAATNGAEKYDLVSPNANFFCVSLQPIGVSPWEQGFVRFNVADGSNKLSAVVSLKGAKPDTKYAVRLIQGLGTDCFTIDGYVETNGQGNGTLQVTEDASATGRAQVIVTIAATPFNFPSYRGTDIFTW